MIHPKVWPMEAVAKMCLDHGLTGWPTVTFVSVAWAESRGDTHAVGLNDYDPASKGYLSLDLGLWQTNSYWHPEILIREALDPELQLPHVMRIARRVSPGGWVYYSFEAWHGFTSGNFRDFVHYAVAATRAAGGAV